MKFTFILGYRHKKDRLSNLKRTLEWMYTFTECEIILVEQDAYSKIKEYNFFIKHIFLKSNEPYNRSWAFNVGLKYSTTNIIVFTDSDLIIEDKQIIESIKLLDNYDVISPYSRVIDLNNIQSKLPYDKIFKLKKESRGELDNQKINLCGGMVIFNKDSVKMIGGWCEYFTSWGGEDNYQTLKVNKFLKFKEIEGNCYHFYHEKQEINPILYANNLKLLEKFKSYNDSELINEINKSYKENGRKNKYS